MRAAALPLDLEVFHGPFDLLLTLVLREDLDLLEVELAAVVVTYVEHLESAGELDLEATTEFLVLIAALLELKSRLILPREDVDLADLEPGEAAEELLQRMLEYRRYRRAAELLVERLGAESAFRFRSAPVPLALRRAPLEQAQPVYDPGLLSEALGGLLRAPPAIDTRHIPKPVVAIEACLAELRALLSRRGRFRFEEAVAGADRLTEAVTVFALLELYKTGEAGWEQDEPFGPITVVPGAG